MKCEEAGRQGPWDKDRRRGHREGAGATAGAERAASQDGRQEAAGGGALSPQGRWLRTLGAGVLGPRAGPDLSAGPQCAHADPCFTGSNCINTMPGFHCEACPRGYKGTRVSGVGIDYARASKQVKLGRAWTRELGLAGAPGLATGPW